MTFYEEKNLMSRGCVSVRQKVAPKMCAPKMCAPKMWCQKCGAKNVRGKIWMSNNKTEIVYPICLLLK